MSAPLKNLLAMLLLAALPLTPSALAQNDTEQADDQETDSAEETEAGQDETAEPERPRSPQNALIEQLLGEIAEMRKEVTAMREQLATANLEADLARRELAELEQFIKDNREYGDDFAQYQAIKEIAERDERIRRQQEARARREEEMARRRAQRDMASAQEEAIAAEQAEMERYQRAGFEPLGLDVYLGRTGFFYHSEQQTSSRIEYEPLLGTFLEPVQTTYIDYSEMTISGSVLNTSEEVRNLGVAIAFFDRRGNQVGAATVQINNARPKVPYPFTSLVKMALDEPFASSSSWVLYADPVE
jgi:hypothetical protein